MYWCHSQSTRRDIWVMRARMGVFGCSIKAQMYGRSGPDEPRIKCSHAAESEKSGSSSFSSESSSMGCVP